MHRHIKVIPGSPEKEPQFNTFTVNPFGSDLIRAFFAETTEGVVCIHTKVWTDGALGLHVSYCVETKSLKKWILSLISLPITFNPLSFKSDQREISPYNISALENKVVIRIEYMIRSGESSHSMSLLKYHKLN